LRNFVKEKLRNGGVAVGAWMSILNPSAARIVASSGLDWVLFDTEHGPPSFETVDGLVRAVGGAGALPLVRVVWNDINAIKQALDTGAYGVIVPWVNTKEEAERAVTYCRYQPEGLRGCAPGRAASAWGVSSAEYLKIANDEVLVVVQIETTKAMENIEEVVSVEGVDATFIGPSDLGVDGAQGRVLPPRGRQCDGEGRRCVSGLGRRAGDSLRQGRRPLEQPHRDGLQVHRRRLGHRVPGHRLQGDPGEDKKVNQGSALPRLPSVHKSRV